MRAAVSDEFLWSVEEACCNAYPASRELLFDGWMLRASGGQTRRINSVNPTRFGPEDPSGVIDDARAIYGRLGQPTLFRVPSLRAGMEAPLASRGFTAESETVTLMAEQGLDTPRGDAMLTDRLDPTWLGAWTTCRSDADAETIAAYTKAVEALLLPAAFACRMIDGQPVAVAYAARHRGIAILESVVTHPDHRGRGYARDVVASLMAWAHRAGAHAVCLQVGAANEPARALYKRLGFSHELYRYHYRISPPGA